MAYQLDQPSQDPHSASKQPVRNEPVKPVIGFKIYEPLFPSIILHSGRQNKSGPEHSRNGKKVVKMRLKNARNYFFRRLLNFLQQKLKSRFFIVDAKAETGTFVQNDHFFGFRLLIV